MGGSSPNLWNVATASRSARPAPFLLSSLPGFAITAVRNEKRAARFSTMAGVKEDVTNVVLNLKEVRCASTSAIM